MPGRGPQTFKKRQKEQQRKEKQQEKMAKRLQRKDEVREPEPLPTIDPITGELIGGYRHDHDLDNDNEAEAELP
jgi:hypothetical protein